MTDVEKAETIKKPSLEHVLRRVQLVFLAAAIADVMLLVWFRHIGTGYHAHICNAAITVQLLLYGHNINRVLYVRMVSLIGLYFAVGYAVLSTIVLPDARLVFLNLAHQPLQFLWLKVNAGLIVLITWLVLELHKPSVAEAILKANPLANDIIGSQKKSLPYVFQLVFVTIFMAIMYSSLLPASKNKQFSARAVSEAELSLRKNSEDMKYEFYVEWLDASYSDTKGTHVWGKVSVYDGKSLQSIPVEWNEK